MGGWSRQIIIPTRPPYGDELGPRVAIYFTSYGSNRVSRKTVDFSAFSPDLLGKFCFVNSLVTLPFSVSQKLSIPAPI